MTRVVEERRNRQTGTTIQLVDRGLDDFEREDAREHGYDWHRWETICVEHGTVCSHVARDTARAWMAEPTGWCEVCREEAES